MASEKRLNQDDAKEVLRKQNFLFRIDQHHLNDNEMIIITLQ